MDDADDALLDALVQVSFEITAILSQVAAAHELSLTQLRLIAILCDREPTMSGLADHLGLDRSSVSGLIDRAAARGLVHRVASETDRRSSRVALTAPGRALALLGAQEIAARVAPLLAGLDDDRRATLAASLMRMLPARG